MKNAHSRHLSAPPESVRAWIPHSWSGTAQDIFPRDVIRSWRRNPPGEDVQALLPGVTELGHGPLRFRLRCWDGARFEVALEGGRLAGWHGFLLEPDGDGSRITHTLVMEGSWTARLAFALGVEPIHDWVVESMFDRLEVALRNGQVPAVTTRPRPGRVRLSLALLRAGRATRRWLSSVGKGPQSAGVSPR